MGAGVEQAARLSVVVDRLWRAEALAEMIAEAGLQPELARTDENTPLVRTALDARLTPIATSGRAERSRPSLRSGCRARGNCGPGRWPPAPPKPTATCSGWTRTPRIRIPHSHRR